MATIALVSFRLGGTDGVAIEAAKWCDALRQRGHAIRTVAGTGVADVLVPGLAIDAALPPTHEELRDAFGECDLVIVENLASLPLNIPARDVLYDLRRGRPTLFRHHDLPWQRPHLREAAGPQDDPAWSHVVINRGSQRELAERGITSSVVYNHFDCDPPTGHRETTRAALGLTSERLFLFPSRAIPRKNVAGALALAHTFDAVLWLLGPAEDGYDLELATLLEQCPVRVRRGGPAGLTMDDAYAAADLVVVSSTWEGFGNPVLESVTHRRPLALYPYPVAQELLTFGFAFTELDDHQGILSELTSPNQSRREHNLAIAREHFSLTDLPARLEALVKAHW